MAKANNSTQVLKAGLWILENVGWIQGTSARQGQDGKYTGFCASGALGMVETSDSKHLQRAFDRLSKEMGGSIIGFNDRPDTTKQMVINRLKRAIKKGSK